MPEVRRGSLAPVSDPALSSTDVPEAPVISRPSQSHQSLTNGVRFDLPEEATSPVSPREPLDSAFAELPRRTSEGARRTSEGARRNSDAPRRSADARRSLSYAQRPQAEAYYDSRAATRQEYRRRATTLLEYYDENSHLLPQLPFTWHHGWKRWRLFMFAFLVFVDASAVPIALYYGLKYAGDVEGWIIFAVVTTIWGGPTYLEFAIRTLRLIKVDRFYRPLGTNHRWCFDMLTYSSTLTIFVVTALFIIGSAPHNVWLRVLCMPAPAILYCYGGVLFLITLYHQMNWPAPFRISSTAKGEKVLPGVYYFIEDVIAVNALGGRPYREALAARYKASPRFRQMVYKQSWFWSIPALVLAVPLTVISVIPQVPATGAYGVAWAVPFLWAVLWGIITIKWCKRDMKREREEWELGVDPEKEIKRKGSSIETAS
ncbi:hypothetical protein FMUND_1035 [Fusarium mundagurra]|uniref:Uncharacterized protein n=1 Tax=Fusarium mundagurra TaxID=1567541 RepID=A0A8H6DNT1_9HYPO|nr:hypothetical protein FMUND_1035 [Fusarium mundagurra]